MGTAPDRNNGDDIARLNGFLRGEMSAVEAYRIALKKFAPTSLACTQLEACMASHAERVDLLREKVLELGGQPDASSGVWGAFAAAIETGAAALGENVALAALEEGEGHGLKDYRAGLPSLETEALRLVTARLLPEQLHTHEAVRRLKTQMQ